MSTAEPSHTRRRSHHHQVAVLSTAGRGPIQLASVSANEHPPPTSVAGRLLSRFHGKVLLRKEVIQPHLPVRLPCYDFVPIASPTFDGSLHKG